MPLRYGHRISQIHTHGLLVLLALVFLLLLPTFLIFFYFIGQFGFFFGILFFALFCWSAFEIILYYIYKRFSMAARQKNVRKRVDIAKVKSKYETRDNRP